MSKYIDYEEVSQAYDSNRYAVGVETMTNILAGILKKNPKEISMLEAGCGTGNYSLGFLKNGIGHVTMLDASEGMLKRAREKVENYNKSVTEIKQHFLPSLPYPDDEFDVVTFIEVLHHLDNHHVNLDPSKLCSNNGSTPKMNGEVLSDSVKEKYPNFILAVREAYRVLKPGGVLLVDHIFRNNIECCWISLAPKATNLFKEACMSGEDLLDMLRNENFKDIFCVTHPGLSFAIDTAFDNPELILDDKWRNLCSKWTFPERTGELSDLFDLIKKKKAEGTLSQFAREFNRAFQTVGESTTIFARKY